LKNSFCIPEGHKYPIGHKPFDKPALSAAEGLRANGASIENIDIFPFVVSWSNHERDFFNTLLGPKGLL